MSDFFISSEDVEESFSLEDFQKRVGENIFFLRRRRNVTLLQLSEKCGISLHKLDRYERGQGIFRLRTLLIIAEGLDASVFSLFINWDD